MQKLFRHGLGGLLLMATLLLCPSKRLEAAPAKTKVFLLTSTYGVMAGSLTGLASLAFYDDPGNHTRNVAMGASLGLYVGIMLGAYLIWMVPDKKSSSRERRVREREEADDEPRLSEDPLGIGAEHNPELPRFQPTLAYHAPTKRPLWGFQFRF